MSNLKDMYTVNLEIASIFSKMTDDKRWVRDKLYVAECRVSVTLTAPLTAELRQTDGAGRSLKVLHIAV
jgi:hypothetical protein